MSWEDVFLTNMINITFNLKWNAEMIVILFKVRTQNLFIFEKAQRMVEKPCK